MNRTLGGANRPTLTPEPQATGAADVGAAGVGATVGEGAVDEGVAGEGAVGEGAVGEAVGRGAATDGGVPGKPAVGKGACGNPTDNGIPGKPAVGKGACDSPTNSGIPGKPAVGKEARDDPTDNGIPGKPAVDKETCGNPTNSSIPGKPAVDKEARDNPTDSSIPGRSTVAEATTAPDPRDHATPAATVLGPPLTAHHLEPTAAAPHTAENARPTASTSAAPPITVDVPPAAPQTAATPHSATRTTHATPTLTTPASTPTPTPNPHPHPPIPAPTTADRDPDRDVHPDLDPTPLSPAILAIHTVLPQHRYPQDTLTDLIADMCLPPGADQRALRRLHAASTVQARHLALPIEQYAGLDDFGRSNDAWIGAAVELGEEAVAGALAQAGLRPEDVDLVACVSVTGLAVPSVDARLALRMGMRPDVRRLPLFGLGCVAGAAGLARVHDFLRGHPHGVAVLLAVELCSLTLQRGDGSAANLVAGALFGDGAGAVVAVGSAHAEARPATEPSGGASPGAGSGTPASAPSRKAQSSGPRIVATRSTLYPETEHVLGWEVGASGFRVVLTADVPDLVRAHLRHQVCGFLGEHGLVLGDIAAWVCHPGGPKVVEAVGESLGLAEGALEPTWRSLAAVGNLSSASVLHILQSVEESARPAPGSWGVVLALGPGFCSELVLLRW